MVSLKNKQTKIAAVLRDFMFKLKSMIHDPSSSMKHCKYDFSVCLFEKQDFIENQVKKKKKKL